jgi:hypothetical protein
MESYERQARIETLIDWDKRGDVENGTDIATPLY